MAKYLVVYSYQDETQPLLRTKHNDLLDVESFDEIDSVLELSLALVPYRDIQKANFVIENIVKLGG